MYPMISSFISPTAKREQRMTERERKRHVEGCQRQIFYTVLGLPAVKQQPLSPVEENYLGYLCGLLEHESDVLNLHQKARIGNLFEAGCKRQRKYADQLSKVTLPGLVAVPKNREQLRDLQKANGKRKRAAS